MSGHTPGPWWIDYSLGESVPSRTIRVTSPLFPPGSGLGEYIATVNTLDPEAEANARLIAASPELLEAARDAAQHYQSLEEGFIADGLEEVAKDCTETRLALQKAVAKAKGRE